MAEGGRSAGGRGAGPWVVIFGDALEVLANAKLSATPHRVVRPPFDGPARTALAMFLALDELVEPPAAFGPRARSTRQLREWWARALAVSGALI